MTESQIIAVELVHRSLTSGQSEFMAFVPGGLNEQVVVDGRKFRVIARDYIVEVSAVGSATETEVKSVNDVNRTQDALSVG